MLYNVNNNVARIILKEIPMDELTKTNVDAFDKNMDIYVPQYDGTKRYAGHIISRSYETESGRAKRLDFMPIDAKKPMSLGVTTHATRLLDPWTVAEPLMQQGFEPTILKISHGGTDMFGLFTHPNYTYDFGEDNPLTLSFGVWHRTQPGKATIIRGGFYRMICSNGLVASILELGFLRVNHMRLTVSKIEEIVGNVTQNFITSGYDDKAFPAKGLSKAIRIIENTTGEEQVINLPDILSAALKWFITRTPKFRESLLTNLDEVATKSSKPTRLQVVNAVTNVATEYGSLESRPADLYWTLNPAISNLSNIAQVAEFFS
jgi:hypothetical protein